jgi:hypothetical protein
MIYGCIRKEKDYKTDRHDIEILLKVTLNTITPHLQPYKLDVRSERKTKSFSFLMHPYIIVAKLFETTF